MILLINACVRADSRTARIAYALLKKLGPYEELKLETMDLRPLNGERLERRTRLLESGKTDDPAFAYARQFAAADTIVIAAPYWDNSFPAILKTYLENIYVTGIVSHYTADGRPEGLCRAKMLYYVTTAGGPYNPAYSYGYLQDLAVNFFGISETKLICAEMLDVFPDQADAVVEQTIAELG